MVNVFASRHLEPNRTTLHSVELSGSLAVVIHYTANCETWASGITGSFWVDVDKHDELWRGLSALISETDKTC